MLSRTPTEELEIINAHLEAASEDFARIGNRLEKLQSYQFTHHNLLFQFQNALDQVQACLSSLEARAKALSCFHNDQK